MTPKVKAEELVNKFNEHTVKAITYYPNGKAIENKDEAKQCALIAVDEILSVVWYVPVDIEYWQEVKNEIEKL